MANEYKGLINVTTGQEISDANANGIFSNTPSVNTLKFGTDASAPIIKTMKKTGTTGSAGGAVVSVNTGLQTNKILLFSCSVDDSSGLRIPPENSTLANSLYSVHADELVFEGGADIIFTVPSGQTNVASRPFEVFIIYEA